MSEAETNNSMISSTSSITAGISTPDQVVQRWEHCFDEVYPNGISADGETREDCALDNAASQRLPGTGFENCTYWCLSDKSGQAVSFAATIKRRFLTKEADDVLKVRTGYNLTDVWTPPELRGRRYAKTLLTSISRILGDDSSVSSPTDHNLSRLTPEQAKSLPSGFASAVCTDLDADFYASMSVGDEQGLMDGWKADENENYQLTIPSHILLANAKSSKETRPIKRLDLERFSRDLREAYKAELSEMDVPDGEKVILPDPSDLPWLDRYRDFNSCYQDKKSKNSQKWDDKICGFYIPSKDGGLSLESPMILCDDYRKREKVIMMMRNVTPENAVPLLSAIPKTFKGCNRVSIWTKCDDAVSEKLESVGGEVSSRLPRGEMSFGWNSWEGGVKHTLKKMEPWAWLL